MGWVISMTIADELFLNGRQENNLERRSLELYLNGGVVTYDGLLLDWPLTSTIVPNKSTGSPTFTRATDGMYRSGANELTSVGSGVPRFEAAGILIEPASTNLALHNQSHENVVWTPTNITVTQDDETPMLVGGTDADLLTADAGNGTILQTITSAQADRSYQVALKRKTGTGNIDLTVDNGASWTTVAVTSSWNLYAIQQATVTNPIVGIRIVTSGDEVWVDLDQLENQKVATTPIITAGATDTRNFDSLTIQRSGNFDNTSGSIRLDITPKWTGNPTTNVQTFNVSSTSFRCFYIKTTGHVSMSDDTNLYAGGVGDSLGGIIAGQTHKIGGGWGSGTYGGAVDGSGSTPATFDGDLLTIGSNIQIAVPNNNYPINIANIKVYPTNKGLAWREAETS